ncbi:MAG: restriction endonuclease subunit S [Bacteroidales bacterium]|nr:restriction endonuclease subunit S [Bacteroidales bacterium]MCF8459057.1 restriction endonuclease subunit S [Bacteroidales bacterium]
MSSQTSLIGSCPSHWGVVKFSTVAELKHGYQFRTTDFTDQGIKVLKITQIKDNGSIDISSCSYIDSKRLESFEKNIVKNGDILMALSGATIGKIGRYKSEETVLQNYRVGNFIPLNEEVLDKDYFYHFLTTENTYYQILANQNQSAQENVGKEDINKMLVFLPPLPEQHAIASILSSLDDKIDLLHRQNATLEALAETLFRQWFVEEAKEESNDQILLGEVIESISFTHKLSEPDIVFLNTSDIYLGHVLTQKISDIKTLPGQAKKSIQKNDILFSEIRPANGRWAYIDFDANNYVVSTKLMVLRSKGILSQAFVYFYLTNKETVTWLQVLAESRSGTFPQITFDQLKDLKINIPSQGILDSAIHICESILNKMKSNQTQIRTLTALRDTLLPKLMSGEVRVKM